MQTLFVTTREGEIVRLEAEVNPESVILDALRDGGVDEVMALCGGSCACATCHVYVDEAFVDRLPQMSQEESELLDMSGRRNRGSRLACQVHLASVPDSLRITIAPEE